MDNAPDAISVQLFPRGEAKKSAIFFRKANFIAPDVPSPHDKSSRIRRETHPLLAFSQSLPLVYQFSDVHARTDVASEVFLSVVARHTAIRNPAIFAVVTSQPVLHDERFPGIKRFDVGFEAALEIVRMHAVGPAISHFLFHRATGKLEPRLVEEGTKFIRVRHPDKDGRRVSYHAESLLALAHGRFAPLAIRDIANNNDETRVACDVNGIGRKDSFSHVACFRPQRQLEIM